MKSINAEMVSTYLMTPEEAEYVAMDIARSYRTICYNDYKTIKINIHHSANGLDELTDRCFVTVTSDDDIDIEALRRSMHIVEDTNNWAKLVFGPTESEKES